MLSFNPYAHFGISQHIPAPQRPDFAQLQLHLRFTDYRHSIPSQVSDDSGVRLAYGGL